MRSSRARRSARRGGRTVPGLAERDANAMDGPVVDERDRGCRILGDVAVDLDAGDPTAHAGRVVDADLVARRAVPELDLEPGPAAGDAGVDHERVTVQTQPEDPLHGRLVHPARRTGV